MKILANTLKNGNILLHNDDLWKIVKQPDHTKPGKGPAYIQVEMKNLKTDNKLNTRFGSNDEVEKVVLEQQEYQYLYTQDDKLILMDMKSFEQREVDKSIMDERVAFLTDNMIVKVESYNDVPLNIILPQNVVCEIAETEPVIRGASVTSSYKPAKLTNGLKVMVPSYITPEEKIRVKTEDITFIERVKGE